MPSTRRRRGGTGCVRFEGRRNLWVGRAIIGRKADGKLHYKQVSHRDKSELLKLMDLLVIPPEQCMIGNRYGMLTIKSFHSVDRLNKRRFLCVCDCGKEVVVTRGNLASGNSVSCGCTRKQALILRNTKHGKAYTREYNIWAAMKSRGKDLNSFGARNYAMRGITVCERWANSFESFLADVGPCPSPKHSIDRVDNEKGYEPGNVRWATSEQQNNNKRSNRKITVNGVTKTLAQWCREAGISSLTFYARLHKGWRIQDAASFPPTRRKITVNGITKPVTQWLREAGIAYSTLSARLERGWSEEEAVTTPPLPAGKKKIV